MKFRGLIAAAVVLIALGGVLYWSNHHKPAEPSVATPTTVAPAILKLDQGSIAELTLARKGAAPVTLEKQNGGQWQIKEPKAFDADQDAVSGVLSTLSSLNADRVVEDKAADLKPYGLDDPALAVEIDSADHKQHKLMLGDETPAGSDVYAMVAGDPRVYTLASYNKTGIDKGLDDLRDKKLFHFGFAEPGKIELHAGAKEWVFTRSSGDWLSGGKKLDGAAVESLVEKLRDLSATGFPDAGFAKPDLEATVVSGDGKVTEKVLMAKAGNNTIARRESEAELYQLGATVVSDLTTAAEAIKQVATAGK